MTQDSAQACIEWASQRQAEAFWQCAETAQAVRRRHQFFIWTQASLQRLLPHQLMLCSAWSPLRRQLQPELFNSLPLPEPVLQWLQDPASLAWLQQGWLRAGSQAQALPLAGLVASGEGTAQALSLLQAAGLQHLSVLGVSRPQCAEELESFFLLVSREPLPSPLLNLMTPLLHCVWRRVQAQELQLQHSPAQGGASTQGVTERERQVLAWMRQGKSNQEIGLLLGISALTVKNHVQKILRKLCASNRAQAVAQAMSLQLLKENGLR
ncbi:helix-turn-helix transcriptional regulator [Roseateles flavus]|uniref:Helix-turn-helix transcriptional regulator n=1 Tax=Roseateles flavus TaxID=3149041 RepID=A0ABV0GAZ3_9BURK